MILCQVHEVSMHYYLELSSLFVLLDTMTKSRLHKKTHRMKCKLCSKIFDDSQSLSVHSKQFVCEVCEATFCDSVLELHKKTHQMKCKTCNVIFSDSQSLRVHCEQEYECCVCHLTFCNNLAKLCQQ